VESVEVVAVEQRMYNLTVLGQRTKDVKRPAIPATSFMLRKTADFRCFQGEITYSKRTFDMFPRQIGVDLVQTVAFLALGSTFCLFSAKFASIETSQYPVAERFL